jgi:hypothetical protein
MQATKEEKLQQPECPGASKPQAEHEWLQKLVGTWDAEGEAMMGPDQPANKWKATEIVRSIGGMWVVGEGTGDMPDGGTATTIITLGYDPQKGKYVGTFVASMMANMWVYEGSLDAGGNVLTLDTDGPAMTPEGGTAKYQDIIEFKNNDLRTLTSRMQGPDGQWMQIMTATYRRTK